MIQLKSDYFQTIDEDKIAELIEKIEPHLEGRRKRYQRYSRKEHAYEMMAAMKSDNILMPWEYLITILAGGAFSGIAPKYSVKDVVREDDANIKAVAKEREGYQKIIDDIHNLNDEDAKFSKAMHYFITTGAAYEYLYEDKENQQRYSVLDSRNTVAIYDHNIEPGIIAAVIEHYIDDGRVLEIITKDWRRRYDEEGKPQKFEDHAGNMVTEITYDLQIQDEVPIIAYEHPDEIAIYEMVLPLIDFSENAMTNVRNMTEYNDNAKLMVYGQQVENPPLISEINPDDPDGERLQYVNPKYVQEIDFLFAQKAYFFPNEGGAKWLIKDVPYQGIIAYLREVADYIMLFSLTPNLTDDSFSGNASGVAHGYKLFMPRQLGALIYGAFKAGSMRKLEMQTKRINMHNNTNYNHRDVDVIYTQNIPVDEEKRMAMAINSYKAGLLSHETSIGLSSVIDYPSEELERIKAEQAEQMETMMALQRGQGQLEKIEQE